MTQSISNDAPEGLGGTHRTELFPEDHVYFTFIKKIFRHEFRKSGFRRISIPSLVKTQLYVDSGQEELGQYNVANFPDYALKFDGTVSVLSSYIANEKYEELQPIYYYNIDKLFTNTEGELKEFHTISGEIIGEKDPILDVECIFLIDKVLKNIGLGGKYSIRVNSIGFEKEQLKYAEALGDFYADKKHLLTEETIENLEKAPFKVWTPKSEDEEILLSEAPKMRKFLKKHSKLHLEKFESYMELFGIDYTYDDTFILNRPYHMNTVWEFVNNETGEQIASGGRYDTLANQISEYNKEIPGTGFTTRIARIISMLKKNGIAIKNKDKLDLYFVQLGDEAKKEVFPIASQAKAAGINTLASMGTPSIKEQMLKAQRREATFVVIVGIMEARNGNWQVRNIVKGTQEEVRKENLIEYIIDKIGKDHLDFYSPMKDLTITPVVEEEGEEEA